MDAEQLVRERTLLQAAPAVPELRLHLADGMEALWHDLQRELDDGALPPPFWAFAWLGGQALARHVLDAPETVRGLRVLDLATGSGLVALAAARAGAASVQAVDVDPLCAAAVALNARANGLDVAFLLQDLTTGPVPDVDVVLAGDVCYDAAMTAAVLPWLRRCAAAGTRVLLGDPGRHYAPDRGTYRVLTEHLVPTTVDLEGVAAKRVRVLELGQALPVADEERRTVREEFDEAVNMTPKQLREWLETDESKAVGQKDGGGESTGHESGRRIVEVLQKAKADLTEDDHEHMQRVVSYVHRHLAQRPDGDVEHSRWRYSLMNWGHDPLKD